MVIDITVGEPAPRADAALAELLGISRNRVKTLIEHAALFLNGKAFKPSVPLKPQDRVTGAVIDDQPPEQPEPADIPVPVLYEDDHLIVVDKPKGLVVHPAAGHRSDTLVNALLHRCAAIGTVGDGFRPGIVHRLDKDTSGIIVVAKDAAALESLQRQFRNKRVFKRYELLALGRPERDEGVIETGIARHRTDRKRFAVAEAGRHAVTRYRVLGYSHGVAHVEACIETGRTHQIRVHMEHLGIPVVGDPVYGRKKPSAVVKDRELLALVGSIEGQALCACELAFTHPATGAPMRFAVPLPPEMAAVVSMIREISQGGRP